MTNSDKYNELRQRLGSKRAVASMLGVHYMTLQKMGERLADGGTVSDERILALLALEHLSDDPFVARCRARTATRKKNQP